MKIKNTIYLLLVMILFFNCSSTNENNAPEENFQESITISQSTITSSEKAEVFSIIVKANCKWNIINPVNWIAFDIVNGSNGETVIKLLIDENDTDLERDAEIIFKGETAKVSLSIHQQKGLLVNTVPEGYKLVWNDEFDQQLHSNGMPALPDDKWWFEVGNNGWGNNEDQHYVDRFHKTDTVAKIKDGRLIITAIKIDQPLNGSNVVSARMNTKESWKYGYFEMKAKLPGGKGTWAAFWMMPKNFNKWPDDGEIDILEYVGYRPNVVQSTIHTKDYNHVKGTEKTGMLNIKKAEEKDHVYGLLWTDKKMVGYCDGVPFFEYLKQVDSSYGAWPFDQPFYLKLNLAIGGNWGGLHGVDQTIFPAEYSIDYVRVYQK